jgi:hypothetical protein
MDTAGDGDMNNGGGDLSIEVLLGGVERKEAGGRFAVGAGLGVEVWDKGRHKYYCNDVKK